MFNRTNNNRTIFKRNIFKGYNSFNLKDKRLRPSYLKKI